MSERIESEEGLTEAAAQQIGSEEELRKALQVLAEDTNLLFIDEREQDRDQTLYHGLVQAYEAIQTDDKLRYQQALQSLESVEPGCNARLKPEYRAKYEACLAVLREQVGRLYVRLLMNGEDAVTRWLHELKSLYIGAV